MAAGVVVEKECEYVLASTGLRALDRRPETKKKKPPGGAWVGVTPGCLWGRHAVVTYTILTFLSMVQAIADKAAYLGRR